MDARQEQEDARVAADADVAAVSASTAATGPAAAAAEPAVTVRPLFSKKGSLLIAAGIACVFSSISLTAFNVWDQGRAGVSSAVAVEGLRVQTPLLDALPADVLDASIPMPVVTIDGRDYIGTLVIDSLGLELPVQSQWSDAGLRVSPCRYVGSAYADNMVIAAHNYPTHFGDIGSLTPGDTVRFCDADGNEFTYEVGYIETLGPTSVEEMTQTDDWDLTLFTCTLGGASRVTVRCIRVD